MADPKPIFHVLDNGSNEGTAPHSRVEGDSPSAQQGLIGFSFKDSSGDLVLPSLDPSGRLPVTMDASGSFVYGNGEVAAGSLSLMTVATVTLTTSKTYVDIAAVVSCFRESLFQVIWNNNAAETILMECLVGPGHFSFQFDLPHFEITSGGTGTQQILVKGQNLDKLSSLRATASAIEVA